jgi:hypothetical protein
MSEGRAFRVFVAVFSGGLALLTVVMVITAVVLFVRRRRMR